MRPLFSDIPLRRFADGDQFWRAELGLVGVDRTNKEVRVIANVLWGFDVHAATKTISPRSPIPLENPTTQYLDTLTRYFDNNPNNQPGKPGTVVWTFNRNMALMAVPEPSLLAMVVPAAAFLMFAKLKRALTRIEAKVPIAASYPLARAADAHRRLESDHVLGRIVLTVHSRSSRP